MNDTTRLCKVGKKFGFFHIWELYSEPIGANPMMGGAPAGVYCRIFGIVEFTDGVKRVDPTDILFCDEQNDMLLAIAENGKEKGNDNTILEIVKDGEEKGNDRTIYGDTGTEVYLSEPMPTIGYREYWDSASGRWIISFAVPISAWDDLGESAEWRVFGEILENCQAKFARNK